MRRHLPAALTHALAITLGGALTAPLAAQEGLEGQVARLLQRADAGQLERVWDVSAEIVELDGQEDALARAISSRADQGGALARLAAARALLDLSSGYADHVLQALDPLCKADDGAVRGAAMGMLGTQGFFRGTTLRRVRDILEENTSSELAAPHVRVEAAKSLWRVGSDAQRSTARSTLQQFLTSADRELRVEGALALAEINVDSSHPAWQVLREIQDQPTDAGRLARSYLRLDSERRRFEHLLRRSLDARRPGGDDSRYGKLEEIMAEIRGRHTRGDSFDEEFMIDNAAKGMLRALDRHSAFFTSEEYKAFFFDLNREYGGIGAFVNFDRDDVFSIVRPIYSGPAYRAGLRSGDKILEVDGWETAGQTSEAIIAKLKGKPSTPVKVKIYRPGMEEPEDVEIVREQINVPSVNFELLPGNIGYVELITFGGNTAAELRAVLSEFERVGVAGLVLDVRSNTGGYLLAAREVVELFVEGRKRVVYTKSREGIEEEHFTHDRAVSPGMPLVVLTNEYSASASEIVAGALQDYGRAAVVGKRTYGKGSVQQLIPLDSEPGEPFGDQNRNGVRDEWEPFTDQNGNGEYDIGPRIKLTVARYYLPSGRTPNKEVDANGEVLNPDWGVTPDHEVELFEFDPGKAWMVEALRPLVKDGAFNRYVEERLEQHKDLFLELANGDDEDASRYPDFEEFYASLDTKLPRDEVRRWIRYRIRDAVSDLRGKAFAGTRRMGDFQEDPQLQFAVRSLLEKRGVDIREIKAYQNVLKLAKVDEKAAAAKNEKEGG